MKKKFIEILDVIFIALLLTFIIFSSIMVTYLKLDISDYSIYLSIFGGIFLIIYIISKINNFKFKKLEIIIIIMMILSCLSLISAINIGDAIFGKINRNEGLLVWITYYLIALNAINIKREKNIKIVIGFICLYSFINILYGLFQVGILNTELFEIKRKWYYARGFLGNSMYMGTLMSIFYGLVLGFFLKCEFNLKKILLCVLLLIASIGVVLSGAMSSFASVIIIYLIALIQIIVLICKREKNSILHLAMLIVGVILFVFAYKGYTLYDSHLSSDLLAFKNETISVSSGKIEDSFGTGRIHIWKETINKIKEAPITGFGIDNFRNAFDSKLLGPTNRIVDKAHNDYLQKALCEGIISGLVFVIFLLIIFFKLVSKKLSPVYYGLFMAFTSYSVQAFFNISVTRVAPIYFIIIGLLIGGIYEKD